MQSNKALLPLTEAQARILKGVNRLGVETVPLDEAAGRVLARNVKATRDQPPFAASAMDGYAVRSGDVATVPARLDLIGQSAAGKRYSGTVRPGQAVRIFTGAPVPKGADCIVIQENTRRTGDEVEVLSAGKPGQFIRPAGLDFRRGGIVLEAGVRLQARHIGVAASANVTALAVRRRPVVAILATGDELVAPGKQPAADQIIASNNAALAAAVTAFGGEPRDLGIVRDDIGAISAAITLAREADILLTTGGASVGDHDYLQDALKAAGLKLGFWRIAMRPGKPLMFARRGRHTVIGLPGNPVSALVCARIFVKPLIAALTGDTTQEPAYTARLTTPLPRNDERQDHLRASLDMAGPAAAWTVTPFTRQDSSMQHLLARANCLIVRPPHARAARKGQSVPVLLLDS